MKSPETELRRDELALPSCAPLPDLSWQQAGRCNDRDEHGRPLYGLDVFFPNHPAKSPAMYAAIKQARAICATCPIQERCRTFARETNQVDGIWGGETRWQRLAARYPRRRINGKLTYVTKENA